MHRYLKAYFALGILGTIASIVGIGTGLNSLFGSSSGGGGGGGGSGGAGASTYVPQWQGGADQMWQQLMQTLGSQIGGESSALLPFLMSSFSGSAGAVPGIQNIMDTYGRVMERTANTDYGAQTGLENAGNQIFQMALDPQSALYDRTVQQLQDQVRGADSARGVAMGDVSAGNEGSTLSNFNIDWQNNLLNRAATGGQSMAGLYNAAGSQGQAGNAALAGASNLYTGALGLPFNVGQLFSGDMSSLFSGEGALGGMLGQYMGLGQSGSSSAFNQGQTGLNNLTSGLLQLSQQPWAQSYFAPQWQGTSGDGSYNPDAGQPYNTTGYGGGAGP